MKALIFDGDGTLADTEPIHLQAYNQAFAEVGLGWYWDEALYIRLLSVSGGKERLAQYWKMVAPEEASSSKAGETIDAVHAIKTRHYARLVSSGEVKLRPGIGRLIEESTKAGLPMAIATTTTPSNLDALMSVHLGERWRNRFVTVRDGGTTQVKKPDPQAYLEALDALQVRGSDCLAFEDSGNGLLAAQAAGIPTVVTPTPLTAQDCFDGALLILPNLGDPGEPWLQPVTGASRGWADLAFLREQHKTAAGGAKDV